MYYSIGNTSYLSIDKDIDEDVALRFKYEIDLAEADPNIENIEIKINSVGGSVLNGYTIMSSILTSKKNTITINTGACYSTASWCFLAGKERKAFDYSILLIHNPFYENGGGNDEYLKMIQQSLTLILSHSFDANQLQQWLSTDKKFTAQELFDMNIIDEIITSNITVKITEGNTAEEIYNIMNKVLKNNNSKMNKDEIKNELVEDTKVENEVEVKVELEVEIETKPEEVEEINAELEEYKNAVNELKEMFKATQAENLTLKEEIENLKVAKVEAEKVEVLNIAGINDKESWMKLDIADIKNLINTVPVKRSPRLSDMVMNAVKIKATMDDYTSAELMDLYKNDEATYLQLFKNTEEARKNKNK